MRNGLFITNGGPHSAADWAERTAGMIVDIADVVGEVGRDQNGKLASKGSAIKLQAAIIDILEGHHTTIQNGERTKLGADNHARLAEPIDPNHHLNVGEAVKDIQEAAKGTQFEETLSTKEAEEHLTALLHSHFGTSIDIDRQWHCDRNSTVPECIAYKASRHPGTGE